MRAKRALVVAAALVLALPMLSPVVSAAGTESFSSLDQNFLEQTLLDHYGGTTLNGMNDVARVLAPAFGPNGQGDASKIPVSQLLSVALRLVDPISGNSRVSQADLQALAAALVSQLGGIPAPDLQVILVKPVFGINWFFSCPGAVGVTLSFELLLGVLYSHLPEADVFLLHLPFALTLQLTLPPIFFGLLCTIGDFSLDYKNVLVNNGAQYVFNFPATAGVLPVKALTDSSWDQLSSLAKVNFQTPGTALLTARVGGLSTQAPIPTAYGTMLPSPVPMTPLGADARGVPLQQSGLTVQYGLDKVQSLKFNLVVVRWGNVLGEDRASIEYRVGGSQQALSSFFL